MRSDGLLKHLAGAFVIALLGYATLYSLIEHARTRKGPWEVTFRWEPAGVPAIVINQPRLRITNVVLIFPRDKATTTNVHEIVVFDHARPVPFDLPFGRCVFFDATSLPGSATLELFGEQIELLPRVLQINGRERPWKSGETINLPPAQPRPNQEVRTKGASLAFSRRASISRDGV